MFYPYKASKDNINLLSGFQTTAFLLLFGHGASIKAKQKGETGRELCAFEILPEQKQWLQF